MNPIAVSIASSGSYGALELKRDYRRNMLLSIAIAAGLHLAAVVGMLTILAGEPPPVVLDDSEVIVAKGTFVLAPPPSIEYVDPGVGTIPPDFALAELGTPVPWPDDQVAENPQFPTRMDLARLATPVTGGVAFGEGDSIVFSDRGDQYWPVPEEFVFCQEYPKTVHFEAPVYPEMAELTGLSGTVWIQALIDKSGHVRDARVKKASGANAGFEQAALSAAFKNVYKPAIQNGQPVAVWISYKVEFRLR